MKRFEILLRISIESIYLTWLARNFDQSNGPVFHNRFVCLMVKSVGIKQMRTHSMCWYWVNINSMRCEHISVLFYFAFDSVEVFIRCLKLYNFFINLSFHWSHCLSPFSSNVCFSRFYSIELYSCANIRASFLLWFKKQTA